jgi:hypothetical protein
MIKQKFPVSALFSPGKMFARMSGTLMTRVATLTSALATNPLVQLLDLDLLATQPKRTRKPKLVSHGKCPLSTTKESLSARTKRTRTRKK